MVAKFNKFNRNWQVFHDEEKTSSSVHELSEVEKSELQPLLEAETGGNVGVKPAEVKESSSEISEEESKKGKNKNQKNNLRGKPYTLRDGGLLDYFKE